jgi:NAD(P)-dependent dehydrogenase (short-subunit alcohol dehydrogenase family)
MPDGSSIINTSSINGLRGNKTLIDDAATKGAVLDLTYSLAQPLARRGIRVICVAPGPVWTPLIPATSGEEKVATFGQAGPDGPGRPAGRDCPLLRRHADSDRRHVMERASSSTARGSMRSCSARPTA